MPLKKEEEKVTKQQLSQLWKDYLKYLDYWNKKEAKKDRPMPIDGIVYSPSFNGFMEWIEETI